MKPSEVRKKAQELFKKSQKKRQEDSFKNTIAWLSYLGLLRSNKIHPERKRVTLDNVLRAAEAEPRIYELLPAMLIRLKKAIVYKKNDVPDDLSQVVNAIKQRRTPPSFRGIPAETYMQWLKSNAVEIASRRLNFRSKPRKRMPVSTDIGQKIRDARLKVSLTQQDLAKRTDVSVRVIRDLEQGRLSPSLKNTLSVLHALSIELEVR